MWFEDSLIRMGKMCVASPKDKAGAPGACPAAVWDLFKWKVDPCWLEGQNELLVHPSSQIQCLIFDVE